MSPYRDVARTRQRGNGAGLKSPLEKAQKFKNPERRSSIPALAGTSVSSKVPPQWRDRQPR
jgi:hypothetical protein